MQKNIIQQFNKADIKSKNLIKNIFLSFGVKGLAILVSLVNIPIFLEYFNDSSVLGIWFTLLAMLNWILTFDLGIGNGLRNYLVIAIEKDDQKECQHLVSSAYYSITILVVILSIVFYFLIPRVSWNSVCNIGIELISADILNTVIRILLIGILLQFLLKLITSILYAMQKPAIPNFLLLISNILLLCSTFFLNTGNLEENLLRLSIAYVITSNLPLLLTTLFIFGGPLKYISLKPCHASLFYVKKIISLGVSFLVLQLLSMASFNTREFYIMRFLAPNDVVPYQVYQKLFSLVSTFFILAMTPMWSSITQAAAQNDYNWIKRKYNNVLKLFGLFTIGSCIVIIMAQSFVNIWLGEKRIQINFLYSIAFVIFNIEYMWINLHSQFENGLKRLRAQKKGYLIATFLLPILAYILSRSYDNWIFIVVANIVALLPICIMQFVNMQKFLDF